jgi:hypothetical protein
MAAKFLLASRNKKSTAAYVITPSISLLITVEFLHCNIQEQETLIQQKLM